MRGKPEKILSIDPGSYKSGLAVLSWDKEVLDRKIIATREMEKELGTCIRTHKPDIILMGNGTWSKKVRPVAQKVAGEIPLEMVNEKHSTERARMRYFQENPPRGFWKLIPVTLQIPRRPIDDLAAIILAEDYLDQLIQRSEAGSRKPEV